MATRTYRRYSTEFKLQLVRAHLVTPARTAVWSLHWLAGAC